jgi:hypothetical protein
MPSAQTEVIVCVARAIVVDFTPGLLVNVLLNA